jgi:anti-anti-sigma factor
MGITSKLSPDGRQVTITVSGRFDFETHQDFSDTYRQFPKGEKTYLVDLGNADYVDSSALGMLLQLRDHSDKAAGGVLLANANHGVREILRIANFDKLFELD